MTRSLIHHASRVMSVILPTPEKLGHRPPGVERARTVVGRALVDAALTTPTISMSPARAVLASSSSSSVTHHQHAPPPTRAVVSVISNRHVAAQLWTQASSWCTRAVYSSGHSSELVHVPSEE